MLGPLVATMVIVRPALPTNEVAQAGSADIAITKFLEATGSECYVYATSTFDPLWLQEVEQRASDASGGWIVEGAAWMGPTAADAAKSFGATQTLAGTPDTIWVLTVVRDEVRAVELGASKHPPALLGSMPTSLRVPTVRTPYNSLTNPELFAPFNGVGGIGLDDR